MGRGGGRSRSAPARRAPPPRPTQSGQQQGGGMASSFLGTMVQGFAFGTGSSVAREAVHGIMGGGSQQAAPEVQQQAPQQMQQSSVCEFDQKALLACLNNNPGNAQSCDVYMDALRSCQANAN